MYKINDKVKFYINFFNEIEGTIIEIGKYKDGTIRYDIESNNIVYSMPANNIIKTI